MVIPAHLSACCVFATAFLAARTLGGLDIFGGLSIKILIEHLPNYDIHYLQSLIGVAVAVDAHLYGYIMGILAQLVYWGVKAFKKPADVQSSID